jgi:hypothetical protein
MMKTPDEAKSAGFAGPAAMIAELENGNFTVVERTLSSAFDLDLQN